MALTEKQRERRRESLGGSDIAVLLGHSLNNEYDLWLEKKHGVEVFSGNKATEFGEVVEPSIARWAAGQLGVRIVRNVFRAHESLPFHANLDARVVGRPEAVEVKFTGYQTEKWGDEGTDDIPHTVVCQTQWQCGIGKLERVHVAGGLTPDYGFNRLGLWEVEAYPELQERMIEIGKGWWDKYIIGDEVPDDLPSESAIKAVQRVPNFEVWIDRDLVAELKQAQAEAREANALVKELKAQLHRALYDPENHQFAEVGRFGDGDKDRVTYFEFSRKGYEVHPGTYRRLSLPREM